MDLHEVGAYVSLMSAAWSSDSAGCLPDDDEKLRRWARMSRDQWAQSRETLLSKFPIGEPGTRVNPRLYREAAKQKAFSASQSEKGRKGGRPKAEKKPGVWEDKPGLSVGLSPEKPSVSVSASASASALELKPKAKDISPSAHPSPEQHSEFLEAWNSNCGTLPKILKLSSKRMKLLSVRTKAGMTLEQFTLVVQTAARTPFLRGDKGRGWKCDFDFLLNEDHFLKCLEGGYGEPDKPRRQYRDITDTPQAANFLTGGSACA